MSKQAFSQNGPVWPLVGNDQVVDFLVKSLANRNLSGSYIFLGPSDLGKTTVAKFFIKSLLCSQEPESAPCDTCQSCRQMEQIGGEDDLSAVHSDYHLLRREPDKKNISIEQVREFNKILNMSSFLNSYKTGIIKDAESLSLEASNALLKTLEEPKKKVVIILIASNLENIPQTIVSRSQTLNFYPVNKDHIYDHLLNNFHTSRSVAKNLAHLSLGRPALAVKLLEDKELLKEYQDKAGIFLDVLDDHYSDSGVNDLGNFLGEEAGGREGVKRALNIIEVWRGVARDIVLMSSQNKDLIQYEIWQEKLERVYKKFDHKKSLRLIGLLQKGERQVKNNVNPRLVLENILFNINLN